ncbi:hypothetical protein [Cryptosporangium sp. NPDC048952]|uniref:hypothetical protein n=1 Tax=Cryptosporangium sp. NPDC048952 TaxID=3363961 RepID=UPI0037181B0C
MESGPAPAHPLTEPGRTTVQLLVASSAVLALIQLVAATSVDVYNGERAGWWIAIQGATVAFAAAFAGAAASGAGASWRRNIQKSSSTTGQSLGTGIAAASVAGAVFSMLCWASTSLGDATYPMVVAVFVAAMLGGVVGAVRVGGAVLGGLVSTFAATLMNLVGQALIRLFTSGSAESGTPLGISAVNWGVSAIVGSVAGVWWLSRRRQRSWWSHWSIVGLYPVLLVGIGDFAELLAWIMVDDPEKGEALGQAVAGHVTQLVVMALVGGVAALVAGRALRAHPEWLVRPRPARVPADADVLSADIGSVPTARDDEFIELAERAAQAREVELAREAEELEEEPDRPLTAEEAALVALADRAVQAREAELAQRSGHTPRHPTPPPPPAEAHAAQAEQAQAAQARAVEAERARAAQAAETERARAAEAEQARAAQADQARAAQAERARAAQAAELAQAERAAQELADWAAQADQAQQAAHAEHARHPAEAAQADDARAAAAQHAEERRAIAAREAEDARAAAAREAEAARAAQQAAEARPGGAGQQGARGGAADQAQTARLAALIRAAQASEPTAQTEAAETDGLAARFQRAQRIEQAQEAEATQPHPVPAQEAETQPLPQRPEPPVAPDQPTVPIPTQPAPPQQNSGSPDDQEPSADPDTTVPIPVPTRPSAFRNGNGTLQTNLTALIPTQQHRPD